MPQLRTGNHTFSLSKLVLPPTTPTPTTTLLANQPSRVWRTWCTTRRNVRRIWSWRLGLQVNWNWRGLWRCISRLRLAWAFEEFAVVITSGNKVLISRSRDVAATSYAYRAACRLWNSVRNSVGWSVRLDTFLMRHIEFSQSSFLTLAEPVLRLHVQSRQSIFSQWSRYSITPNCFF